MIIIGMFLRTLKRTGVSNCYKVCKVYVAYSNEHHVATSIHQNKVCTSNDPLALASVSELKRKLLSATPQFRSAELSTFTESKGTSFHPNKKKTFLNLFKTYSEMKEWQNFK